MIMIMDELLVNLHMHTRYSDGHGSHQEIAQAALKAGLDAVIVTDHNVWVDGQEKYYEADGRRLLLMVGEEVHDQAREPQKNHLLVFGAQKELATLAHTPQQLLDGVNSAGGLAFLAHIVDPAAPAVGETDISWVAWDVQGFTGIELWNGFSEFKMRLKSKFHAIYYAYNPKKVARGPHPEAIQRWDELLSRGRRVVAIGGSDAHALPARLGPLRRTLFPYLFHYQAINTHLLVPRPLSGDALDDSRLILEAFRQGHAFIGYDLPAPTRGFRFTAQGLEKTAWMGDEIPAQQGVTFQIKLPKKAECLLLKDGKMVKTWQNRETCTYITTEPGVYRVEVYVPYAGRRRGWIFSNPIYVRA
jgi:hypothetical protein